MTYQQTIDYLYALTPAFERIGAAAYKPGLGNMLRLMDALGNPHKTLRCLHVAGTNGKGSTAHMLAAILQAQGCKTGLYTSPHLVDFAERIRVDGKEVEHDYIVDFVERYDDLIHAVRPSFFELATAMAFCYFRDMQTDICVIEVGLGGRLDSTNVITPLLSVITNIGFDHTAQLGNTLESIAREKAGIIKQGIPVVIGEADRHTRPVFEAVASERHSLITFAQDIDYDVIPPCQLTGDYQRKNLRTVLCAVDALRREGIDIEPRAVAEGLLHVCDMTGLRGRWQILGTGPLIICDTGHNAHGLKYVARQLGAMPQNKHIVFGMVADKDYHEVLRLMPPDARYYFTQPDSPRALKAAKLTAEAQSVGLKGQCYEKLADALTDALNNADKRDVVFVGGSNYLVGEFLAINKLS